MGDVKTGEGTMTALQLTCCMENGGAMICCSNVYRVWGMPMLHWEGCVVTLLVGTSVCIGWLRSMRSCPSWLNSLPVCLWFTSCRDLVLVWENIIGLL